MKPLTKPIQTRVNRLAHRIATQQEPRIKSELIMQLQAARKDGATLDDLSKLLDAMESPARQSEWLHQGAALASMAK